MSMIPKLEIMGMKQSEVDVLGIDRNRNYTSFEQIFEQTAIADLFTKAQRIAEERHDNDKIEVLKSLRQTACYSMQCLYNAVGVEYAMKHPGLFFDPQLTDYPSVHQEREYLMETINILTRNVFIDEMLATGNGEVLRGMTYAAMDNEEFAEKVTDLALADIREYYPYAFQKAQKLGVNEGRVIESQSHLRE